MEKEKLAQARKTFAEDSEKFYKYQSDLNNTTKEVSAQFEKAVQEKNQCVTYMKRLDAKITSKEIEIKRVEDNL